MSEMRRPQNEEYVRLDPEGNWFQGEYPILHDRTCRYLHKNIDVDDNGNFYLSGEEKPIFIVVEDVPYWVTRVEKTIVGYLITLTDESIELLEPDTLWSKKDVLYCAVKGGRFGARFQRNSYYDITKGLEQKGSQFSLVIGSKRYPIGKEPPKSVVLPVHPSQRKKDNKRFMSAKAKQAYAKTLSPITPNTKKGRKAPPRRPVEVPTKAAVKQAPPKKAAPKKAAPQKKPVMKKAAKKKPLPAKKKKAKK